LCVFVCVLCVCCVCVCLCVFVFVCVCIHNSYLCLKLNGDVYNYVGVEVFGRFVHKCC